jgi:HD-GYP domain-containing protein (c-di-GMP phosphodiesterase class II)
MDKEKDSGQGEPSVTGGRLPTGSEEQRAGQQEGSAEGLRFTELKEVSERVNPERAASEQSKRVASPTEDLSSKEKTIKSFYDKLYNATNVIYQASANGGGINISPLVPLAEALAELLVVPEEEPSGDAPPRPTFYREVMVSTTASLDWPAHGIHVATLAVKIGDGAGYSQETLKNLALAGLVHDVGMMCIPTSILESPGKLTTQERSVVQTHPVKGAEMIGELGPQFEWLQAVILQEHERYKGQGYPNGISGRAIDEFARIIGMVDTFVAMTQPRTWRPAIMPHDAAKELVYVRKDEFDPNFVKLFLKKVSIFPINSLVRLSNNEIGQILNVHEDSPLRPTLEILQPSRGRHLAEHKVLDLKKRPLIYITGSISEKELAEFLQ